MSTDVSVRPEPVTSPRAADDLREFLAAAGSALAELARRPLLLWSVCLLADAAASPYAGLDHDALLYAFQAVNRASGGAFGHDLFFRYGSQDSYSAFSLLTAPAVSALGVDRAFLAGYLLSRGLFALAAARLCLALLGRTALGAAAAVASSAADAWYGGIGVFAASEPFLTPRLPAAALALIGFERLLARRLLQAGAALLGAAALHPLIAFPAFLIGAACLALARFSAARVAVAVAACAAGLAGVLADRDLAGRLLGLTDPEWVGVIRKVSPHLFPEEWYWGDFRAAAAAAALMAWFAATYPGRGAARLAAAAAAVGAAGLLGSEAAARLPYALPLQGQPFRCLWPMHWLQVPAGAWLAGRCWGWGTGRGHLLAVAVALAAFGNVVPGVGLAAAVGLLQFTGRGVRRRPALALGIGAAIAATPALVSLFFLNDPAATKTDLTSSVLHGRTPALILTGFVLALGLLQRRGILGAACLWAAPAALACQLAWFAGASSLERQARRDAGHRDADWIGRSIPAAEGRVPTVYWPINRSDLIWHYWGWASYFHFHQASGVCFSRETAAEAARRARAVSRFAVWEFVEESDLPSGDAQRPAPWLLKLYDPGDLADQRPPTEADLRRLCADPGLDYVVIRQNFPGLALATNGRWSVYDARELRGSRGGTR